MISDRLSISHTTTLNNEDAFYSSELLRETFSLVNVLIWYSPNLMLYIEFTEETKHVELHMQHKVTSWITLNNSNDILRVMSSEHGMFNRL